jgi:hypothetical protein
MNRKTFINQYTSIIFPAVWRRTFPMLRRARQRF